MSKQYTYLDNEVIKKFQEGDSEAFEEIYQKYQTHIYRLAYQFTKNEDSANDIVQETFLKAYEYKSSLNHPEALFTWLSRIAYGKCVNQYQKSKQDASHYANDYEDGFPEERFEDHKHTNSIDKVQMKEAKAVILSAFDDMNPEWKLTGYLRFFEELSIKEIAEVMDVPSGTVLSRLSRIKKVLKVQLAQKHFTKETCFSALLVPNMIDTYQSSNIMDVSMPLKYSKKTWNKINKTQLKIVRKMITIPNVLLVSALVLPIGLMTIKSEETQSHQGRSISTAQITNVDYLKELTNQPLKIKVETTNDNYDQMELNGKNKTTITRNGEYIITLVKDNKIIDEKKIVVNNVDMDIPIVVEEIVEEDQVLLTLTDTDTEIDFSKVVAYDNGMIQPIEIDATNKKVTVKKVENMNYILEVPDILGNVLKVTINYYKFLE